MPAAPARKRRARKTPTHLSLPAELVRRLAEHEQAIGQYNAFVERHGAFSDDLRAF